MRLPLTLKYWNYFEFLACWGFDGKFSHFFSICLKDTNVVVYITSFERKMLCLFWEMKWIDTYNVFFWEGEWDVPHWACGGGGVTSPFKNDTADYDTGEHCGVDQLKCQ